VLTYADGALTDEHTFVGTLDKATGTVVIVFKNGPIIDGPSPEQPSGTLGTIRGKGNWISTATVENRAVTLRNVFRTMVGVSSYRSCAVDNAYGLPELGRRCLEQNMMKEISIFLERRRRLSN
jgi:hypothetical protein